MSSASPAANRPPPELSVLDGDAGLAPQGAFPDTAPFRARVRSEVVLAAPSEDIWRTLTTFEDYAQWNAFTPRVRTELVEGAAVHLEVHFLAKRPMNRVEWMHSVVIGKRLCWGMRMGPLLRANRSQWLIALGDGTTLYRTDDVLTGALTPLVMSLYGDKMQAGFDAVCDGLLGVHGGETA